MIKKVSIRILSSVILTSESNVEKKIFFHTRDFSFKNDVN